MKRLAGAVAWVGGAGPALALICWLGSGPSGPPAAGDGPGARANAVAAAALVALAFAISAGLWAWAARRWFGDLGAGWRFAGLLALGAGNYALVLPAQAMPRAVATAAGYLAGMMALTAVAVAATRQTRRSLALWLAIMSAAYGLAVVFRPVWSFGLWAPAAITVLLAGRSARGPEGRRRPRWLLLGCGWLPAALLGLGAILRGASAPGGAPAPYPPALAASLFGAPELARYFPFFHLPVVHWGCLWCAPLAALGLVFPLSLLHRDRRRDPAWRLVGGFAWGLGLSILVAPGSRAPDPGDALPLLLWSGTLVGLLLAQASRSRPAWFRLTAGAFAAVVAATVVSNALLLCAEYPRPDRLRPLARWANRPVAWVERWRGIRYGPLTIRLLMPYPRTAAVEPLVVTARGQDAVLIRYLGDDTAQIVFDHSGQGGMSSAPFRLVLGRTYEFLVQMGSLFPPRDHPFFAGCSDELVDTLHHTVLVAVNGQVVLDGGSDFFPSRPAEVFVGRNPLALDSAPRFTGEIVSTDRPGLDALGAWRQSQGDGALRLTLRLPPFTGRRREPLLSTGRSGAGDLIFVEYLGPREIRFGHDNWGGGAVTTRSVTYDPSSPQVLEVDFPPLHRATEPGRIVRAPLALRFNGRLLWHTVRPAYTSSALDRYIGFNGVGATDVNALFNGCVASIERTAPVLARLDPVRAGQGPLLLELLLPRDRPQRSEPLLVSGRPGAGDLVYIRYTDEHHVQFGLDHWLVGGPLSPPIPIDYGELQDIGVGTGTLYPPADAAAWGATPAAERQTALRTLTVTLNDRVVLTCPLVPYAATSDEIHVGRNPIGGSSCDPAFSGAILRQVQTAVAPPAPPAILTP